ncbi:MAG: MFS transporter [Planctomycetes bacterium]|nr:MFS transporter [Planctomycetota bacterium]
MNAKQRGGVVDGVRVIAGPTPVAWGVAGLAVAMLTASLGASIQNVALPSLAIAFGASFAAVQWLVVGYLLTSTAVIVAVGRAGDVFGMRRLLLGALALFLAAAVACGLAPSLPVLIAARAVQGVGAAGLTALTVALARSVATRDRTGSVMGLLGTMSALGTALGPALGGVLLTTGGWRAVFLAVVPLAALAFALVHRHLPPAAVAAREARGSWAPVGTTLLALTLTGFALAVTGRDAGWRLVAGIGAVAAAIGFVASEGRTSTPLIPWSRLRQGGLRPALVGNGVVAMVMMATLVVGPFHLVHALGMAPDRAGLVMAIGPAVSALVGVPAGRLVDRLGAPRVVRAGWLGVAAGTGLLAALAGQPSVLGYVAPLALATGGYSLFVAANNTAVMTAADAGGRGVLAGLLNLARNLGLLTGATVLGWGFAAACGTDDIARASPDAIAAAMRITFLSGAAMVAVVGVLSWRGGDSEVRA